ncbi:hypothetical protein GGI21_000631 [Coemansia aciculifera]|nr:hypothetical protein GGI21_000631 [Coemansia aciculifera]
MLAIAAAKHLLHNKPKAGASQIGRATYQTHSQHGHSVSGTGKWPSRLLAYLREALGSASAQASKQSLAGHGLSNTAASRLREAMPRGLGWASRFAPRATSATKSAVSRLGAHSYFRSISQRLAAQLRLWPGASRLAVLRPSSQNWAFGSGGRWSPYLKTFARNMSTPLTSSNMSSARAIMAQIQRQTMIGLMTQQRREFSMVSPLAYETRIRMLAPEPSTAGRHEARALSTVNKTSSDTSNKSRNKAGLPSLFLGEEPMHPAARASQVRSRLADQCVTITIPYAAPTKRLSPGDHGLSSPNDAFRLLADADKLQRQHHLLLTRLMERLSATGWDIHYQHVSAPTDGIEIALPSSSGIRTVVELESLLCDWGLDTSHLAASLRGPRAQLAETSSSAAPSSLNRDLDSSFSCGSESMDSKMFSLIVDAVVDPEEAYREDVRDFLSQLEQMPRLSASIQARPALPNMATGHRMSHGY